VAEVPTPAQAVKTGVCFFLSFQWQADADSSGGGPTIMSFPRPFSPDPNPSKRRKVTASGPNVECCIPRFLVIRRSDTETMNDLSPFYIQKVWIKSEGL
jgi:hypothetical protein